MTAGVLEHFLYISYGASLETVERVLGLTSEPWIGGSLELKSSGEREMESLSRDPIEVCYHPLELVLVGLRAGPLPTLEV